MCVRVCVHTHVEGVVAFVVYSLSLTLSVDLFAFAN